MKGAHLGLLQTFTMAGAYSISTKRRLDASTWAVSTTTSMPRLWGA